MARNDAARASAGAEAKTGVSDQIATKKHNWLNIILIAVIAVPVTMASKGKISDLKSGRHRNRHRAE
ncbi:hypothetical protein [Bifidobacterium subtile]|uniref:Uncharacterized protein n=1 Tax=Bifidobacterium subtile TaxID=77635 RepID=A0A087E7U4_9BIFI|nr:hypothetical protein [Bifidobacterium subtile]KFJ03845.1 hypothetical protein BISU_0321 [Bifidobacterium subtile]QOL36095.1 hypothetical protein BS3272_09490 [Bifidobacterium subtile]